MNLIGIAGRMGHGKDTVAEIIRELTPSMNWEIKKFAGGVKKTASILTGFPESRFEDPIFKQLHLSGWGMTVRELLQRIGTDAIRNNIHPDAWVKSLFAVMSTRSNWLITDVRFPNEAQAIKDRGGIVIRVKRPFVPSDTEHISETALDDWKFDFTIDNSGSLADLKASVAAILRHYGIGEYGDGSEVRG